MFDDLPRIFADLTPAVDYCSLRVERERNEVISVRRGVLDPVQSSDEIGAMVTVAHQGGLGYAATQDLSAAGLRQALASAQAWAERSAGHLVFDATGVELPHGRGEYRTPVQRPWAEVPLQEKVDLLLEECQRLQVDDRIVDSATSLWWSDTESLFLTSAGGEIHQHIVRLAPFMTAVANEGVETQTRSFGGNAHVRQGGLEILDLVQYREQAPRLAQEALELLAAPNCPSGRMDLVLEPDQMILQIHESIGHPLELDRILGDERNYAGTSFVKPEFFGSYQYGSKLLNITFDPTDPTQFASYGFDDEGLPASKEFIIKEGILLRGLGGAVSQARSGLPGVANSRACSWNRPPIDRMANLNLEPGDATLEELIGAVHRGVLMRTNCSWSIDDSRNKFQFGCEYGRLIEDGELRGVVKNCNYRGISATFWRSLARVGNRDTVQVLGTPNCGKGEPNQAVRVGHASPAALFTEVDVFGGE
jgi:predicted Zn-dependent protease